MVLIDCEKLLVGLMWVFIVCVIRLLRWILGVIVRLLIIVLLSLNEIVVVVGMVGGMVLC